MLIDMLLDHWDSWAFSNVFVHASRSQVATEVYQAFFSKSPISNKVFQEVYECGLKSVHLIAAFNGLDQRGCVFESFDGLLPL